MGDSHMDSLPFAYDCTDYDDNQGMSSQLLESQLSQLRMTSNHAFLAWLTTVMTPPGVIGSTIPSSLIHAILYD